MLYSAAIFSVRYAVWNMLRCLFARALSTYQTPWTPFSTRFRNDLFHSDTIACTYVCCRKCVVYFMHNTLSGIFFSTGASKKKHSTFIRTWCERLILLGTFVQLYLLNTVCCYICPNIKMHGLVLFFLECDLLKTGAG